MPSNHEHSRPYQWNATPSRTVYLLLAPHPDELLHVTLVNPSKLVATLPRKYHSQGLGAEFLCEFLAALGSLSDDEVHQLLTRDAEQDTATAATWF